MARGCLHDSSRLRTGLPVRGSCRASSCPDSSTYTDSDPPDQLRASHFRHISVAPGRCPLRSGGAGGQADGTFRDRPLTPSERFQNRLESVGHGGVTQLVLDLTGIDVMGPNGLSIRATSRGPARR